jgi:hypothetical protein
MAWKLRKFFLRRPKGFELLGELYYRFPPVEQPNASLSRGFDAMKSLEVDGFLHDI